MQYKKIKEVDRKENYGQKIQLEKVCCVPLKPEWV